MKRHDKQRYQQGSLDGNTTIHSSSSVGVVFIMDLRHSYLLYLSLFGFFVETESLNSLSEEGITAPRIVLGDEFDDRTLLDAFGEAAKHFLTQKIIPETDSHCRWDWRSVRCEPFCDCALKPKRGDYHLGRSCRAVHKADCDPVASLPESNSLQLVIQRMVAGSRKAVDSAEDAAKKSYRTIQARVCEGMEEVQCSGKTTPPVVAWQERLFCQHMIPHCETENTPSLLQQFDHDIPVTQG